MSKKSMSKLTHIRLNPRSHNTPLIDDNMSNTANPQDSISDSNINEKPYSSISEQKNSDGQQHNINSQELSSEDDSKADQLHDAISSDVSKAVEEKPHNSLPQFLSRLQNSSLNPLSTNTRVPENRALAIVGEKNAQSKANNNPNSFSSIFNKDHQEITGIQRVFKKSIAFMLFNLVSFGALALVGINLISSPIWLSLIVIISYLVTANVFYIIVADRSYVWLGICSNMLLLLLVQSFLGQGFTPVTLLVAFLVGLLTYTSYSELEKIQLGSRLFSISHIIGETTRILGSVVMLVLCLGLFNTALSETSVAFIDRVFIQNDVIFDNIVMPGISDRINLNQVLIRGSQSYGVGNQRFTFADFLEDNYIGTLITDSEESGIIVECQVANSNSNCDTAVDQEVEARLLKYRDDNYAEVNLDLDTVLKGAEFERVVAAHYKFLIRDFEKETVGSPYILVPLDHIIPAILAIGLYVLLLIIKPIFGIFAQIVTWILWTILKYFGFVRIEVENVEAEVVSI